MCDTSNGWEVGRRRAQLFPQIAGFARPAEKVAGLAGIRGNVVMRLYSAVPAAWPDSPASSYASFVPISDKAAPHRV